MKEQIHFIGAGKLGTTLARAMYESGWTIPFFWIKNNFIPVGAEAFLPKTNFRKLFNSEELKSANVIILTVSDDQIRSVAEYLNSLVMDWSDKIVLHTSGSLNVEELVSLKNKAAVVGSIHPMQTFDKLFLSSQVFKDIYLAVEGDDHLVKFAGKLASKLKSNIIKIKSNQKIICHAAAVSASNFFTGLLNYSENLFKQLNIDEATARKIIIPIVKSAIHNFEKSNSKSSLTGPLSRGDVNVVAKQLSFLKKNHEDLYPVYLEISHYIFRFMIDKGTTNYEQIKKLFKEYDD